MAVGLGQYGSVDLFTSDDGRQIALKTPIGGGTTQEINLLFDEARAEFSAHQWAYGPGHENVVGLVEMFEEEEDSGSSTLDNGRGRGWNGGIADAGAGGEKYKTSIREWLFGFEEGVC